MDMSSKLLAVGCVAAIFIVGSGSAYVGRAAGLPAQRGAKPPKTEIATLSKLPSLGGNAVAWGVNEAGTIVVGQSYDRSDSLFAVKWTIQ